MVVKHQPIPLIAKLLVLDQADYSSVYFKRPIGFRFDAGDWMDLHFTGRELKGGITYSISSSPLESDVRISFRHGISEFKQALQTIKPGDELYISLYGNNYDFALNTNKSSVLIAGGVGIAPFRSMLAEMYGINVKNDVRLIYLNQGPNFLFMDELEMWSKALSGLIVHYIDTKTINRKKREQLIKTIIRDSNHMFYIAGPEGMVETNEHLLFDMGVPIRNIRIDSFGGY